MTHENGSGQLYKIKHSSGRILGPLDLERVRALVLKNQITGIEIARTFPVGEWVDINTLSELSEILLKRAEGSLKPTPSPSDSSYRPIMGTQVNSSGPTEMLPGAKEAVQIQTLQIDSPSSKKNEVEEEEKTVLGDYDRTELEIPAAPDTPEANSLELALNEVGDDKTEYHFELDGPGYISTSSEPRKVSEERTVMFQRSELPGASPGIPQAKRKFTLKDIIKGAAIGILLGYFGYDYVFEDQKKPETARVEVIRAKLPSSSGTAVQPELSATTYADGMKYYVLDTVVGYRTAADYFLKAASIDNSNIKAVALLASCYINLIDSSNKDENYFSVISKLIDMSRAKAADLPETIIADTEFFIVVNRPEAGLNRVVEYTKTHPHFGFEMFYYLSYAFYAKGDAQSAARYLAQFPDNKVFTPKIFYLRGQIAEKLGDQEAALQEYQKALKFSKTHAKSRLKIVEIMSRSGKLKEAAKDLEILTNSPKLLAPKDLARAYFLFGQYNEQIKKNDIALQAFERATKLDKDNHDYLMELFTLRAHSGDAVQSAQKDAKMYYYLGEGEKLIAQGKYQEALSQFLEARQTNLGSTLPLVKIGDMFVHQGDISNAKLNYQIAANKAPENIEIWSKYITILIKSYDWDEVQKAMEKFRKLPVSQSAIDKAAGDLNAKQGNQVQAQIFYKKAMAHESIDPDVYIAYANSLMATRNFKDAPFFFALALRFDPLNVEAVIGTAKCIASSESIDDGISFLQNELQKEGGSRAELITAIAELQIQKGEWSSAQQYVDQAMALNPDYALPWKIQAQIDMNKEGSDKKALDKALDAYKSYSDRNLADPTGYLERYRIYTKKTEYEKAGDELSKIYGLYPKYPNLHFYKGALYSIMGNHKAAVEEFKLELVNNTNSVTTMLALGKSLIELGDAQAALVQYNKAAVLAPTMAEPKYQSAFANYLLKNYQGAVALYNSALVYDKANPLIFKRLGMAYRDMGDAVGAKAAFKKYLEMEPDAPDRAEFQRYL